MYKFADRQDVKELKKWCEEILHEVQKQIKDYFTFDFRLIGSGDESLVTQNANEAFDLDYNIIIQSDKKNLLDDPKQIKDIFVSKFNDILGTKVINYEKSVCDSTSVITAKVIIENRLRFSFDVAILVENNDGVFYRLTNDKHTGRYIWNAVPQSADYLEKFQRVKAEGSIDSFRKRYLDLKNMHLQRKEQIKSFSIFLETLNEF